MNTKNKEYFISILNAYLRNEKIDPKDFHSFLEMLQDDQYDQILQHKMEGLWNADVQYKISDDASDKILKNISQHRQENSPKKTTKPRIYQLVSLAAAACILVLLIVKYTAKDSTPDTLHGTEIANNTEKVENSASKPTIVEAPTTYYGRCSIDLPDGSKVFLNENSTLSYNKNFNENTREVSINGEAFFDVAHNKEKPFIVHYEKVSTTVLGTAFNVKTDKKTASITVTVIRGKVRVEDNVELYGVITPNQQIHVDLMHNTFEKLKVNAAHVTNWKDKYLYLNNVTLEEAMDILSAQYAVKYRFADEKLKNIKVDATFHKGENLQQITTVLGRVINAQIQTEANGEIIIKQKN